MENTPLIAGLYRVIGKIGAGGGGVVYLGEHIRLGKKVVLKADKRTLTTDPEILRREVDALKNLSHTYIPQVYDFLEEDGIVYTVMDFIDGDSLDKPLKRRERFSQGQIIEWACQLLEALAYLHSRPPHGILHADIKPSNIMLTPQGDIRLIDFNIALALGEEGAVAVGRSFGYASPEHYGLSYSSGTLAKGFITDVVKDIGQDSDLYIETVLESKDLLSQDSNTMGKKTITLDVRSDIYSLGATLYHLMTGERPARNPNEINPISGNEFSPALISIIEKAMNPNPDLRWQSAEEMLRAFLNLREDDPRTKRYKRTVTTTLVLSVLIFLTGVFTTFVGLKQMEQLQNAYVLAEYSENYLRSGDVDLAIEYALRALPEKRSIFTPSNTAEAQKALTDALNVYDLADGFKIHKAIELPSAPLFMEISPDGKSVVAVYANNAAVLDTDTAEVIATLQLEDSALAEAKFLDNDTIIYAGKGGIKAYNIRENLELWTGRPATSLSISADGKRVAAVYKDETSAIVYDTRAGSILHEVSFEGKKQQVTVNDIFANPKDNLFALNHDGTLLGVSFADGSLWIYNLLNSEGNLELLDETSNYTHFEGGFFEQYFALSATEPSSSIFVVIDTIELEQTGGFESRSPFGVEVDESGIYVQTENLLVNIHPVTGEQTPLVTTSENIVRFARSDTHTLMASKDAYMFFDKNAHLIARQEKEYSSDFLQIAEGTAVIGSLDTPLILIMKYESHPEANIFTYDPSYIHDEARVSADRATVMLFSYDQFRLYDIGGEIIAEVQIPNAEQVYDQQYRRDEKGSRLEVIYNDGKTLAYSAKDGTQLYETMGEKPDLTLYEEFFTDTLRIESPLHGTPMAYDKSTGKLVRELEKDAYLTYVTQVGDYIITQYITTDDKFYGVLLNSKCETLAYLPYLCDIIEDKLIFDYPTGNLRESRIYNINELIELAQSL